MIDSNVREGLEVTIKFVFYLLTSWPQDPAELMKMLYWTSTSAPAEIVKMQAHIMELPARFANIVAAAATILDGGA